MSQDRGSEMFRCSYSSSQLLRFAVVAALLSAAVRWLAAPAFSWIVAPRIETDSSSWVVNAFVGDEIEHSFMVKNRGLFPVTLQDVYASCSCTKSNEELVGRVLDPGESLEVPFSMDSGVVYEDIHQYVILLFETSGVTSLVQLACEGNIRNRWIPETESVEFDRVPQTKVIRLKLSPGAKFVPITEVSVNHRGIWAGLVPSSPESVDQRLKIAFSGAKGSKRTQAQVFLSAEKGHVMSIEVNLPTN